MARRWIWERPDMNSTVEHLFGGSRVPRLAEGDTTIYMCGSSPSRGPASSGRRPELLAKLRPRCRRSSTGRAAAL